MGTPPVITPSGNPPPSSDIQTLGPLVGFETKKVPPSQYLYMQQADFVLLNVLANFTIGGLTARYRYLTPQGEIKEGTAHFAVVAAPTTFGIQIGEGWLLSIAFQGDQTSFVGAWMFVQAVLSRGFTNTQFLNAYGLFWEGYITINAPTGWPGSPSQRAIDGAGMLRSITGTTPAAGAEINEVVPAFRRWALIALRATITTSAAAANRQPRLLYDDGANIFYGGQNNINVPASGVASFSTINTLQTVAGLGGDQVFATPLPFPLKQGCRIRTNTPNLQAGDQWSAPQYLIIEWGAWDS